MKPHLQMRGNLVVVKIVENEQGESVVVLVMISSMLVRYCFVVRVVEWGVMGSPESDHA